MNQGKNIRQNKHSHSISTISLKFKFKATRKAIDDEKNRGTCSILLYYICVLTHWTGMLRDWAALQYLANVLRVLFFVLLHFSSSQANLRFKENCRGAPPTVYVLCRDACKQREWVERSGGQGLPASDLQKNGFHLVIFPHPFSSCPLLGAQMERLLASHLNLPSQCSSMACIAALLLLFISLTSTHRSLCVLLRMQALILCYALILVS